MTSRTTIRLYWLSQILLAILAFVGSVIVGMGEFVRYDPVRGDIADMWGGTRRIPAGIALVVYIIQYTGAICFVALFGIGMLLVRNREDIDSLVQDGGFRPLRPAAVIAALIAAGGSVAFIVRLVSVPI